MLKQLRRKLAFVYTLMAGAVLALVSFACLRTAENQLHLAARPIFENGMSTVVHKLQSERTLSQSWLAQHEVASRQIIYIEDSGVPLAFRGAWTPKTDRTILIEHALRQADMLGLEQPKGTLVPTGVTFEMPGVVGDRYYAGVSIILSGGQPLRVAIIKDRASEDESVRRQRKTVLLLSSAGLLLLMASGWIYSGRAVKPAEDSHNKQVEFIALASHEMKAPLSVITASADALEGKENNALLRNIKSESARMARLVDDLLLLSRVDAKTWSIYRKPVDTDTLLIECYELYYPIAKEKQITLTINLPDTKLPTIYGDMERLKQVLSVLLDNALTYTPMGGHVELSARADGSWLRIAVSDNGPGIPPDQRERVFDRFYRVDSSHADRDHAGLGLSIARELVQLHNGRIGLESITPHGVVFVLDLPVARKFRASFNE